MEEKGMKKIFNVLLIIVSLCLISGCMSYVNTEGNKNENIPDAKEEISHKDDGKEEPINPVVVQKLSIDEAKEKAEKTYGGKGMTVRLDGEYAEGDIIYYVFDFGADMGGVFSKDFSVVVDAQSGEMFEGTYDKANKKIIRY